MTPFVLDASVTVSWCFEDESTPATVQLLDQLRRSYAEVPALWMYETVNVLYINERRKRITAETSSEFLIMISTLDIRIASPLFSRDGHALRQLAQTRGLTAYDAAYLELAKRRGLPLATFDTDLIRAARLEGVALISLQS